MIFQLEDVKFPLAKHFYITIFHHHLICHPVPTVAKTDQNKQEMGALLHELYGVKGHPMLVQGNNCSHFQKQRLGFWSRVLGLYPDENEAQLLERGVILRQSLSVLASFLSELPLLDFVLWKVVVTAIGLLGGFSRHYIPAKFAKQTPSTGPQSCPQLSGKLLLVKQRFSREVHAEQLGQKHLVPFAATSCPAPFCTVLLSDWLLLSRATSLQLKPCLQKNLF